MKTFPIPRKLSTLRREFCPTHLLVDWICFLCVGAAVVIKHQIGVHLQFQRVRRLNEIEQLGL